MSHTVISVENVSKYYRLGLIGGRTLRADFERWWAKVRGKPNPLLKIGQEDQSNREGEHIWALRDVSFQVQQGEVLGIIGRNGAGKSTLLKILSRVTAPTSGQVKVKGRVASLLEVGTGFHPELTGRENIYLNGAILGMKRAEIERKFDEIVAFAEIEKFMDTPVKRYSSGMYVRLAFAVAAHLEPEILLVDEVLAVGDAAFQKKCLGKMGDVAKEGRTVLFVSHNMVAVQSLCGRAFWLNDGKIVEEGSPNQVISKYLQSSFSTLTEQVWNDIATAPGTDKVRLHRVCVQPEDGTLSDQITRETPFVVDVNFWNLVPGSRFHITLHFYTEQGIVAFTTGSGLDPAWGGRPLQAGLYRNTCHIPNNLLNSGRHRVVVLIVEDLNRVVYRHEDAISFDVVDLASRAEGCFGREPGVVQPSLKWTTQFVSPMPVLTDLANIGSDDHRLIE